MPGICPLRRLIKRTTDWHLLPVRRVSHVVDHPFNGSLELQAIISDPILSAMAVSGADSWSGWKLSTSSDLPPKSPDNNTPIAVHSPRKALRSDQSMWRNKRTVTLLERSSRTGYTVQRARVCGIIAASQKILAISIAFTTTFGFIYWYQHLKLGEL